MVRICIMGYGKMGRAIAEEAAQGKAARVTVIVDRSDSSPGVVRPEDLASRLSDFDVLVDFSSATSNPVLVKCAKAGKKIVVGTTARTAQQDAELAQAVREGRSSAVLAPNFSIGMNALFSLVRQAGKLLLNYDCEIVEEHHNQKKDAPSGTAKKLASIANIDLSKVHAVRAGEIFGEHEVIFAANGEVVRLSHSALSRRCFANGAVRAAVWLADKSDGAVHPFSEVLGNE
jgi:4-hydroxy-tetrahydrodipicolinate reductase